MMLLGFASAQICTNSAVCPAGTRGPLLYMTLTTIPRRVHLIDRVVRSLVQQTRPPDKILLSLPRLYHRFPNETVDASRIQPHPLLSVTECEADYGPGSKILCAVGQLATLLASQPLGRQAFAVICDDDRFYQPSALALLEAAILRDPSAAFSFYTYDLPQTPLRVGQGADILAFDARHVLARALTDIVAGWKGKIDLVAPGVAAEATKTIVSLDVEQSGRASEMARVCGARRCSTSTRSRAASTATLDCTTTCGSPCTCRTCAGSRSPTCCPTIHCPLLAPRSARGKTGTQPCGRCLSRWLKPSRTLHSMLNAGMLAVCAAGLWAGGIAVT